MTAFVDWPRRILPVHLKARVAASLREGGLTRAGVSYSSSEPGGRWVFEASFSHLQTAADSRLFGWLLDELEGGTVMRMSIGRHVETMLNEELGITPPRRIPYAAGGVKSLHSDGTGFAFVPTARSVGEALDGEVTLRLRMGAYLQALKPGHMIGHRHQINRVRAIEWNDGIATVTLRMPLRSDVPDDAIIRLGNLKMLVQADRQSVKAFRTLHEYGAYTQPGQITLMEYLF